MSLTGRAWSSLADRKMRCCSPNLCMICCSTMQPILKDLNVTSLVLKLPAWQRSAGAGDCTLCSHKIAVLSIIRLESLPDFHSGVVIMSSLWLAV